MKRFKLEGMDSELDSFTLQEEIENGDLTPEQISQLDSIQIGESYNMGDVKYWRLPDGPDSSEELAA